MNERIFQLAKQTQIKFEAHLQHLGIDTAVITPADLEKFAELLVQECIHRMRDEIIYNDSYKERNKAIRDMMEIVKQHFGV